MKEVLLTFGKPFELLPARFIKKTMFTCINSTGDWIIIGNDGKRFQSNLSSK
jgi:hypothetical protein